MRKVEWCNWFFKIFPWFKSFLFNLFILSANLSWYQFFLQLLLFWGEHVPLFHLLCNFQNTHLHICIISCIWTAVKSWSPQSGLGTFGVCLELSSVWSWSYWSGSGGWKAAAIWVMVKRFPPFIYSPIWCLGEGGREDGRKVEWNSVVVMVLVVVGKWLLTRHSLRHYWAHNTCLSPLQSLAPPVGMTLRPSHWSPKAHLRPLVGWEGRWAGFPVSLRHASCCRQVTAWPSLRVRALSGALNGIGSIRYASNSLQGRRWHDSNFLYRVNVSGELESCDSFYLLPKQCFTLFQRGWPVLWRSLEHEATCSILSSIFHGYG